jgi:hypothetical protein
MTKNQEPKKKSTPAAISKAASTLGKRGGRAGYEAGLAGRSKKKHSEHSRAGVNARWDRYYSAVFASLDLEGRSAMDAIMVGATQLPETDELYLYEAGLVKIGEKKTTVGIAVRSRWPAWRAEHPN